MHVAVTAVKIKCLNAFRLLIRATPEEREFSLKSLITKLGDKEKTISSRAMSQLLSLMNPFESNTYSNPYYTKGLDRLFIITEVRISSSSRQNNYNLQPLNICYLLNP